MGVYSRGSITAPVRAGRRAAGIGAGPGGGDSAGAARRRAAGIGAGTGRRAAGIGAGAAAGAAAAPGGARPGAAAKSSDSGAAAGTVFSAAIFSDRRRFFARISLRNCVKAAILSTLPPLNGVDHGQSTRKSEPRARSSVVLWPTRQRFFVGARGGKVLGRPAGWTWPRAFHGEVSGRFRGLQDGLGRLYSSRVRGSWPGYCIAGSPPQLETERGQATKTIASPGSHAAPPLGRWRRFRFLREFGCGNARLHRYSHGPAWTCGDWATLRRRAGHLRFMGGIQ